VSHFSQTRSPIYYFPNYKSGEYVVLNTYGKDWVAPWTNPEECRKAVNELLKDSRFQLFFKEDKSGEAILLFAKRERKDEVIRNAERLVKENPKSTYAHFILGSIYALENNLKEANKEFEIALQIDKENPFAKRMIDEIQKISGQK
ncbi:MAG: hypothetical protein AB1297_06365, partial [bacterium]